MKITPIILLSLISVSCCASSLAVRDKEKVYVSYEVFVAKLKERKLLSPRKTAVLNRGLLQDGLLRLLSDLVVNQHLSENDKAYVASMVQGKKPSCEPSLLGRDLGVYCALLCSYNKLAFQHYRQKIDGSSDGRVHGFLPKLFCLAVHRKNNELAVAILTGACLGLNNREEIRTYFAVVLPVFYVIEDRDGLESMCDVLGANYMSSKEKKVLLAMFDQELEVVKEFLENKAADEFVPYMKAVLVGTCMRKQSKALALVMLIEKKLESLFVKRGSLNYAFRILLVEKAREAGNDGIATYLQFARAPK